MIDLHPEERETHLNMNGDEHGSWELFTDDAYWIRRLAKLGIQPVATVGAGHKYNLSADQVLIRKGKRMVSEAQRLASAERFKNLHRTRVFEP